MKNLLSKVTPKMFGYASLFAGVTYSASFFYGVGACAIVFIARALWAGTEY